MVPVPQSCIVGSYWGNVSLSELCSTNNNVKSTIGTSGGAVSPGWHVSDVSFRCTYFSFGWNWGWTRRGLRDCWIATGRTPDARGLIQGFHGTRVGGERRQFARSTCYPLRHLFVISAQRYYTVGWTIRADPVQHDCAIFPFLTRLITPWLRKKFVLWLRPDPLLPNKIITPLRTKLYVYILCIIIRLRDYSSGVINIIWYKYWYLSTF
jgi:hypothetical protein